MKRVRSVRTLALMGAVAFGGCLDTDSDRPTRGDGGFTLVVESPEVSLDMGEEDPGSALLIGELGFPVARAVTYQIMQESVDRIRGVGVALLSEESVDVCAPSGPPNIAAEFVVMLINVEEGETVQPNVAYAVTSDFTGTNSGVGMARGSVDPDGQGDIVASFAPGTITLSEVNTEKVAGNFIVDFVLADGRRSSMMGFFDAPACPR